MILIKKKRGGILNHKIYSVMKIAGQVKGGKRIGKKPRNLRKEHRNEQVLIKGGRLCYVMLCTV